jgi:hypothetical protein
MMNESLPAFHSSFIIFDTGRLAFVPAQERARGAF